jgi:hypothetical protein
MSSPVLYCTALYATNHRLGRMITSGRRGEKMRLEEMGRDEIELEYRVG